MLSQKNLTQAMKEDIPHYRYQISSEFQLVLLTKTIALEKLIELQDLIFYAGNVINEFTNFTIYLKTDENSYDSETIGYFCQSDVMNLMSLKEYEQKYQENGFYIKFQALTCYTSEQMYNKLEKANNIIKKLQYLAKMKISDNIYYDLKEWIKDNIQ